MKRGEKGGEGPAEKQENLGEKLKRVRKRGGHATPVVPFWRLQLQLQQKQQLPFLAATSTGAHHRSGGGGGLEVEVEAEAAQDCIFQVAPVEFPSVSARKLAATLWELHHYRLPISKMHQSVGGRPPRLRRLHHRQNNHLYEDKDGFEHPDPSPSSPEPPGSASSLRRHVASLMQHHRPIERTSHAIQPLSPASYGSSLEVAPYNPAVTPTSSVGLKGRIGEPSYNLRTSTELIKVLNRIWSLEEQHSSNISLIRAMKKELDQARSRVKSLARDQQADRQEIDELMKQIAEDKLSRKSKEHDRINAAMQSVRDELEDERKLRKRSESLHRKLARELYEVKTSFATALKELEKEKQSRILLEDLCDEFAWGIRDYEQELHVLRQKCEKDWSERPAHDRLILHISESWLDERMQMKLEPLRNLGNKTSVVDKLGSEIEAFLQSKQSSSNVNNNNLASRDYNSHKNVLESTPLNVAVSAPQDEDDGEDSPGSDSQCFELRKPTAVDLKESENNVLENDICEADQQDQIKKQLASADKTRGRSLQVKFEEQMARAVSHNESKNHFEDIDQGKSHEGNPVEISVSRKSEICEATEDGSSVRRNRPDVTPGSSSNYIIDNLIRNHYLLSESGNMPPENDYGQASGSNSVWRSRASPVRKWTEKLPSHELEISESSSKLPPGLKENTLKAKLIEARTRGHRSRSRLKGSKISF